MSKSAPTRKPDHPMVHRDYSHGKALFHTPLCAADATRSARNIALWNSYLPTECVRTMVRMGWDYTTYLAHLAARVLKPAWMCQ